MLKLNQKQTKVYLWNLLWIINIAPPFIAGIILICARVYAHALFHHNT